MAIHNKRWTIVILLLLAIIISGAVLLWSRYPHAQSIEISLASRPEAVGEVYVGGAVRNPGICPLREGDTVRGLLQAAGGASGGAVSGRLELYVPMAAEGETPQKVDLNRAQSWLLQTLPGIGKTRAQAIIDYREQNGGFTQPGELMAVEGIGEATYERIKDLVTVVD
jgi:competence protein ComEA